MIGIMAILQAASGRADEVEVRLRELAELTRAEPGAVAYWVHRQPGDRFFVYERYVDGSACDAHFATPYLTAFLANAETLLAAAPQVQRWTAVTGFGRP
jgi:quinol monooxygenase YgiN